MMKKTLLTLAMTIAGYYSIYAQTNTFPSSGNVGIGTNTPLAPFDVRGDSRFSYGTFVDPVFGVPYSIKVGSYGIAVNGNSVFLNGNIGIGTANPGQKLDVNGNIRMSETSSLYFDSSNGSYIRQSGSGALDITASTSIGNGNVKINSAPSRSLYLNFASGDNIFLCDGAAGLNGVITKTGNLGLGTTDTKGYKLAVNGNAIATSMTVKLYSNWPDYVFKPNYQLPSLSEVKTYIDKNQHLQDMPSEMEIVNSGINLGEIVKVQTKKIEELTLYAIEQQAKLEQQDARIAVLETALTKLKTGSNK